MPTTKKASADTAAKPRRASPRTVDSDSKGSRKPAPGKAGVKSAAKSEASVGAGKKAKMVRDSFTMPASEYDLLVQLKKRCLAQGVAAKKSEVLRAAIASMAAASDANVLKAIKRLDIIKTGRPSKGKG